MKNVPPHQDVPSPALQRAFEKKQLFSQVLLMVGLKPENFVSEVELLEDDRERATRSPVIAYMLSLPAFQGESTATTTNEKGLSLTFGIVDSGSENPIATCYLSIKDRSGIIMVEYSAGKETWRYGMELDPGSDAAELRTIAKKLNISESLSDCCERRALRLVGHMASVFCGAEESALTH